MPHTRAKFLAHFGPKCLKYFHLCHFLGHIATACGSEVQLSSGMGSCLAKETLLTCASLCLQLELIYSRVICHAPARHAPIETHSRDALENGKCQLNVGFLLYFLSPFKRQLKGTLWGGKSVKIVTYLNIYLLDILAKNIDSGFIYIYYIYITFFIFITNQISVSKFFTCNF